MLIILSPSKTLNEAPLSRPIKATSPLFAQETDALHRILKKYSEANLKALMGISDRLAALNYERYQAYGTKEGKANAKPALFLFKGDVYDPIPVEEYDAKTLVYAQEHLRILSGFYGLLRPLDTIQPYRLEMGTRLTNERGKDLYAFWGSRISEALNQAGQTVLNLASEEYVKAVDRKALTVPMVTVQFKEYKNGVYKVIGLMAKRARGLMTHYVLQHRIASVEGLKDFDWGDYGYRLEMSDDTTLVFTRGG